MNYGYSGTFANLGPSERRKGQWTRCAEILRLCWIGGYRTKTVAAELGMSNSDAPNASDFGRAEGLDKP